MHYSPPFVPNSFQTGLYGNDDLHNGLLEVLQSGRKVDNIISSVRNHTQTLENTLANKIRPQLVELADIFDQPASNQTALSQLILSLNIVQGNVTTAKSSAADIRRPLMQVTIASFLSVSQKSKSYLLPSSLLFRSIDFREFHFIHFYFHIIHTSTCREEINMN